jgi:hypothetical protein
MVGGRAHSMSLCLNTVRFYLVQSGVGTAKRASFYMCLRTTFLVQACFGGIALASVI